jgi:predicted DNA-binding transcriptional regulator YafY
MDIDNPTARALLALEVLQNNPGISGERLGARLGVSDRAARRYVGVLREAGIPVESTSGRYGGYRLGRGTRLPPLMLSPAEALGLVMTALEARGSTTDPTDPVGTAIGKIIRVLPASVGERADAVRHVRTAYGAAGPTPDPEITAALVQSSAARQRVRIGYRLDADASREMDVDPWAVALRRGRWYLLCWSHNKDARRLLRVDRVASVDVLPESFVPPADLDPVRTIEEHLSEGWKYAVEVVIDAPLGQVERWVPRQIGRLEEIDSGHTRLVGSTNVLSDYARRLAEVEAPFRVVQPPELRDAVLELGRRLLASAEEEE